MMSCSGLVLLPERRLSCFQKMAQSPCLEARSSSVLLHERVASSILTSCSVCLRCIYLLKLLYVHPCTSALLRRASNCILNSCVVLVGLLWGRGRHAVRGMRRSAAVFTLCVQQVAKASSISSSLTLDTLGSLVISKIGPLVNASQSVSLRL